MHSRIIQIELKPIAPDDFVTEYEIPEWFMHTAADYTAAVESREEELEYLLAHLPGVMELGSEPNSFVRVKGAKCEYFKARYDLFREALFSMTGMTLEAFAGCEYGPKGLSVDHWMEVLKNQFVDKYSFYVYDDYELIPLDAWIRQAEEGCTYYFGGVLDYHF